MGSGGANGRPQVTTCVDGTTKGDGEVTDPRHGDLRRSDRTGPAGASLEM